MADFYISTSGQDSNNGSQATPFLTLAYAITQANNGDTIYISSGTYSYGTTSDNNVININKELTIIGRNNSSGTRPIINISTASNNTAVLCNASNITLTGIEFVHNPASTGSNDACINISPGGTSVNPDAGLMVNQNINILDCKIHFTKFGVSSKAKYFSVKNSELVSKAVTTARSIAIYSQDGTIDIMDNTFTASVSNNAIELLHNNFATNDGYQNKRNGTVNFTGNSTSGINITRRAIFFEAGCDTGLSGDTYSFNVSNNAISTTSDCMFLLQPNNANFLNFINLITLNNNTFTNNPTASNNGLVRVASFVTNGGPLTIPVNNPKFLIYLNTINNTTLNLSTSPYNVDNKNVLIFTGFSSTSDGNTGGLTGTEINSILSTSGGKADQTITFNALSSQTYLLDGEINLTATSDSGLSVSYSSDNTSVVDVSGNKLIIKGAGTASITASQAGDDNYNAATNVSQNQVITKADQTITFNALSSQTYLLDGEIDLTATSDSGLSVSYSSDNTSVVDVSGNKLIIKGAGTASITASQAGDDNYNAATNVSQNQVINIITTNISTLPSYQIPFEITATTSNSNVVNIVINISNIELTQNTGFAYGLNTGLRGVISKISITAVDSNSNIITNFLTSPITLNLKLPNANPNNILKIYKLQTGTFNLMTPQPTNFPVTLQHISGYDWTCQMTSLSDFVIQDNTPPDGISGGDPHLKPILSKKLITIPNDWKLIKLYEKNNFLVTGETSFIDADIISNMHKIDGRTINPTIHKYILDYTYFTNVKIYKDNEDCLSINMVNGNIEYDNKKIIYEKIKSKSLYSLKQKKYYDNINTISYIIYLNNFNILELTIDNYYEDLNSFELYMNDMKNIKTYKGELISHDNDNCLLIDCNNVNCL
jgi:hypothetical protein